MRPEPYEDCPANAVNTRQACSLAGVDRVTIWRWIYRHGLRFWRDPIYPHGYYYDRTELQAMKLERVRKRVIHPRQPTDAYDYS